MGLNTDQLRQDMCVIEPNDSLSFENWGKLVKTWVTGSNELKDGNNYSIPTTGDSLRPLGAMTKDQFAAMLRNAKINMTIPDRVKRFVFVQDDDSTVVVRIPAKKVVEDIQGQIGSLVSGSAEQARYPLPDFYAQNWPPATQKSLSEIGLLRMHCQRIGEYTINTCA